MRCVATENYALTFVHRAFVGGCSRLASYEIFFCDESVSSAVASRIPSISLTKDATAAPDFPAIAPPHAACHNDVPWPRA